MARSRAWVVLFVAACQPPIDYPSPRLDGMGLHHAPQYVARDLMPAHGVALMLAHPRLGQPAIRRAGEPFDVAWIAPGGAGVAAALTLDGAPLALDTRACDTDGICHGEAHAPDALGPHRLCVEDVCSPNALHVVAAYAEPARIAQVSDAHIGDGDALAGWHHVVDALNALAPDAIVFTGDAADTGLPAQRRLFLDELERVQPPIFVVTGNHDCDDGGLDDHLLTVGPELDFAARYGALKLIGFSTGQDLDDGDHLGTWSESGGPVESQREWLGGVLAGDDPTIVFFHHPIYNGLFATVGDDARGELLRLVTRPSVRAVLVGHVHHTEVYDRDGESRGLSTGAQTVDSWRWPLHYTCSRSTIWGNGFALHTIGRELVEYRWISLGD
jgi:hypothetical protein